MALPTLEAYQNSRAHLYFFKCQVQECRLEFMVLSWKDNWPLTHKPYCPECNQQKAVSLHSVFTDKQIYEVVYSNKWGDIRND